MKWFGQRAPFGRRAYWLTDEYDTVQKECCALYETYRTTMTPGSRAQFNKRRTEKNKLKRKLKHAFVQKQAQDVSNLPFVACTLLAHRAMGLHPQLHDVDMKWQNMVRVAWV